MTIWSSEIEELEILNVSIAGKLPLLEKELEQLIKTQDANVAMLYSRRCLEVIVSDLCEYELKRPRKTEPLKGIIDKLNSEEKVPSHIITSMLGLNSLSTYGAHPKDFDTEQVKPALSNLTIVIKWYLKYRESRIDETHKPDVSKSELSDNKEIRLEKNTKIKHRSILITIVIVALAVMAVVIVYLFKNESNRYTNLEKSIAVLPFRNDSSDDSTQYFMDGVMEELLTNLQTIKDLRVISRTSVEQYRDQNKPIPEIAQELNVNYIVEGSGQKSGNTLRLRMQLIRAKKESHIWAKSFNSESLTVEEYFSAQSQFAEEIARELNTALTEKEKNLIEQLPSTNLEAYEAYLKGVFYSQNINQNNLDISQKQFELAIEIDPGFAYAYTGIAGIWLVRQQMGFTITEEAGPKAMEAILKAAELDSSIVDVHLSMANINYLVAWDWKTSESEFRKAIAINPNHAGAHGLYAHLLYILGRPGEAIKHADLSVKLDPMNQLVKMWYGFDLLYEKRYDETISICREVLKIDPTYYQFYAAIGEASHLKGQLDEALEATKLYYINIYPEIDHVFDDYPILGYTDVMNLEGDLLAKQSEKKYIIPSDIVFLYVMAGNKEKSLEWLEKGYELRDPVTPYIGRPFITSLLLNEPRYQALLSKLNIPYYD